MKRAPNALRDFAKVHREVEASPARRPPHLGPSADRPGGGTGSTTSSKTWRRPRRSAASSGSGGGWRATSRRKCSPRTPRSRRYAGQSSASSSYVIRRGPQQGRHRPAGSGDRFRRRDGNARGEWHASRTPRHRQGRLPDRLRWLYERDGVRHGLPKQDASGRVADVSAVEVESNAAHQFLQVILAQTGVCAGGTACAAVEAFANAAKDGVSILGSRQRVQLEDLWVDHPRSFVVPAQCPESFVTVLETALLTA